MPSRRPMPAGTPCPGSSRTPSKPRAPGRTPAPTRLSLTLLGSPGPRRETYVGEWIPEPLPERTGQLSGQPAAGGDPADRGTLDESVGLGFLVVVEVYT